MTIFIKPLAQFMIRFKPKPIAEPQRESNSSEKYASISNPTDESGGAYKRESTVASVSNVGMKKEDSRSFTPQINSQITEVEMMRKNFENY